MVLVKNRVMGEPDFGINFEQNIEKKSVPVIKPFKLFLEGQTAIAPRLRAKNEPTPPIVTSGELLAMAISKQ